MTYNKDTDKNNCTESARISRNEKDIQILFNSFNGMKNWLIGTMAAFSLQCIAVIGYVVIQLVKS